MPPVQTAAPIISHMAHLGFEAVTVQYTLVKKKQGCVYYKSLWGVGIPELLSVLNPT